MKFPWSDPNDPMPRFGNGPVSLKEWSERDEKRREAWEKTPEGAAYFEREAQEKAKREAREQEHQRRERASDLIATADERGVPAEEGLRRIALAEDPTPTDALRACCEALRWREPPSRKSGAGMKGMVRLVAGPPGTGKSCAIAWCAVHHHTSSAFVSAATVAAVPRNGWSENEKRWDNWLSVDLLGLDEIGAERGDPGILVYLLTERYNAGLATLIAGNIKRADFGARYKDERLADRLVNGQGHGGAESGLPWFVGVQGASMRGRAMLAGAL